MKREFKKIYIITIFFIGFFIASTVFFIIPLIKSIEKDSHDLVAIKGDRDFFSEEKKNIQKFESVFIEIEPNFNKTNDLFVNSEIPIEFINYLEKTALDSNVSIKILPSVDINKSVSNLWSYLVFSLEGSGSFNDFSRFIEKLENSRYLIQIQNLNIKKEISFQENSNKEIEASFLLKVFSK